MAAKSRIYYGWVIVSVCLVVMTLAAPLLATFSLFYVELLKDLNWSRGDTALALSIFLVVNGLAGPFAGGMIDRFKPRLVMPLGALVTAGALIWMSRMTSLWEFYLAFGIFAAAGSSMLHIVPLSTLVSNWFMRYRGMAIGTVTAGQGVGQMAIPLLQYSIDRFGWRSTYLMIGVILFVIPTVLILLFLRSRPADRGLSIEDERLPWVRDKPPAAAVAAEASAGGPAAISAAKDARKKEVVIIDQDWAGTDWTVAKAIRTSRFWTLTILMALFATGFMMISVQVVAYLTDKGYSPILAASVVGLQGFINIFARFAGGALSDQIGREKTLTISVVTFIICLALLNLAGSVLSTPLVYLFALFYGIGSGMTLPVLMAAAGDIFQGKHLGSIFGVLILGGFFGGALGAWLGGYLFDLTQSYNSLLLLSVVLTLISAALIWKARPSQVRVVRAVTVS
jgi:MFS family permease